MKPTPLLFAGIFASFAAACLGLIVTAERQVGNLQPVVNVEEGDVYPINIAGITEQGRRVYLANGCNYCHTQFVRDPDTAADLARNWGTRRSSPLDYLYGGTATLGVMRNGPDLSNAGAPQEENSPRQYLLDPQWHYDHLYNPRSKVAGTVMPAYRFLFEKRKVIGERSKDAIHLTEEDAVEPGYEVVPTDDAKALVAYLLSLNQTHPLKESAGAAPAAK